MSLSEAEAIVNARLEPCQRVGSPSVPTGRTDRVFLREDHLAAYPVVDGWPILLAPEMLTPLGEGPPFDLRLSQYAEAYEEQSYYDASASSRQNSTQDTVKEQIESLSRLPAEDAARFPEPWNVWLEAVYDSRSQWDAYRHIAPLKGKTVMQLGGSGMHTVRFLLAGARSGWLLTPMLEELKYADDLARLSGVADRFRGVVSVGEEMPFADCLFDVIYSGGCLHHMDTAKTFLEIRRVLTQGGRFAAIDPWKAPLYSIGTKILGKREPSVHCRPIDPDRLAPFYDVFERARISRHGFVARYPLIALNKFGLGLGLKPSWHVFRADDALARAVPPLNKLGSSIALMAEK